MGKLSELNTELQQALADIQFLGSLEQVAYAQKFAEALRGGNFDLDPLLKSIRDELRNSLGKRKLEGNIWWVTLTVANPYYTEWQKPPSTAVSMGE